MKEISRRNTIETIAISVVLAGLSTGAASAAELKVLISGAMLGAVQELAGTFEASSGHKLVIDYATVGKIADRVAGDDPIDVAILTAPFFDKLVRTGKMVGSTTGQLARVPIGLAVKQGAPKPDIASVEAFKRRPHGESYRDARACWRAKAEDPADFPAVRAERGAVLNRAVPAE